MKAHLMKYPLEWSPAQSLLLPSLVATSTRIDGEVVYFWANGDSCVIKGKEYKRTSHYSKEGVAL
jgi:hypothetical protein